MARLRGAFVIDAVRIRPRCAHGSWVLFRSPGFATALAVYREVFAGGGGAAMLSGWQAVLAGALVVFGVLRLLLQRWKIQIGWISSARRLRPAFSPVCC